MSHTSMKELYEAEKDWLIERLSWAEQQRDELLEALNKIASWGEGSTVTGALDEPHAAQIARQALAKHEGKT